jgi:hypothetical protein
VSSIPIPGTQLLIMPEVAYRCINTLNPFSPTYASAHLTPAPDLYGPFWSLTTLIFTLFVTSSLASSIVSYLSDSPITYDFALLSVAVGLVYAYGLALPAILWALLRYWGVVGSGGEGWGLIEALSVWGYGMFVWIPVSVRARPSPRPQHPRAHPPADTMHIPQRHRAMGSCRCRIRHLRLLPRSQPLPHPGVGVYTTLPLLAHAHVLAQADHKSARLLIVVVAVLHAALALVFKVVFFSYYVVKDIGPKDPTGEVPAARFFS